MTSWPSKSLFSAIFLSSLLIKSLPSLRKKKTNEEKKEKERFTSKSQRKGKQPSVGLI
jgi:hypothetical protein